MARNMVELLNGHLAGDEACTSRLVSSFRAFATAEALGACGDADLAEDAAQEALIRALRHLPRLRSPERFPAWLAEISRNEGRRCHERRKDVLFDASTGEVGPELPTDGATVVPGTEEEFHETDAARRAREAMARLPGRLRRPLELRYIHGCSYQEIARDLGTSATTAKGRLQMARDLFREWYEELETCEQSQEQMERFIAGQLGVDAAWQVFDHLVQCDECFELMQGLAAIRAEVLLQRVHHWHGAIDDLRLGLSWETPRLKRRLLELAEWWPDRARTWMLLFYGFEVYGGEPRGCLHRAANVEPNSSPGLLARTVLAHRAGATTECEHLVRLLAARFAGRRDSAVLLDRSSLAIVALGVGRVDLAEPLLRETLAHLRGAPTAAPGVRAWKAGSPSDKGLQCVERLLNGVARLAHDRDSELLFLLRVANGQPSVDLDPLHVEGVHRQAWAKRPLDPSCLGGLHLHWVRVGDAARLARTIEGMTKLMALSGWSAHHREWVGPALVELWRLGWRSEAARHAREYLSLLVPWERQEILTEYPELAQLPGLRRELPRVLKTPVRVPREG